MEKLYLNATFVPMTAKHATAEALVADADGKIAYVGTLEEARRQAPDAQEIDLQGACVMPGFIDPHSHFAGAMQYLLYADLSHCSSFAEIQGQLRAFAAERGIGSDGIIMGTGYDHNSLAERRHPDASVLDDVATETPIVITHASNHMLVANGRMLELAGITEDTPDPDGGRYGRLDGTDTPSGYVEEPAAMNPIFAITQQRMNTDLASIIDDMQAIYTRYGVTTCQDGATPASFAAAFCELAEQGALKIDLVSYPMHGEDVDAILATHAQFDSPHYRGHFRFGGLKMFLDGSPQGLTAWMTKPYTAGPEGEDDWVAYGTMSDQDATAFAKKAIDGNRQLLCHTNGDAAADQLLRVYEAALEQSDNPDKHTLRPVMIHCQTAREDQYRRMAELGMIPSVFASHIWYWGDIHLKNFGQERGGRISACGDALKYKLPLTLHTDTPVLPPNLLEGAWCAVNRITKKGVALDTDQKIDVYQALCAITKHAAYQYGEEAAKGTLEAGKLADMVVLDRNPLAIDPADLRSIKVLETIKEGESVYRP